MNSGLITGLIAGPNRLSKAVLSRPQKISEAEANQALINLNRGITYLGSDVIRVSNATPNSLGLSALTAKLLPASKYRLTYRLFTEGFPGTKIAFSFPSSLPSFDGVAHKYIVANQGLEMILDWGTNGYGSGDVVLEQNLDSGATASIIFIAEIKTGTTANTLGDFSILFSQQTSNAANTRMTGTSSVEVLKY